MKASSSRRISFIYIAVIASALLWLFNFSSFIYHGNTQMNLCHTDAIGLCAMNPLNHIEKLQTMFTGLFDDGFRWMMLEFSFLSLFALVFFLKISFFSHQENLLKKQQLAVLVKRIPFISPLARAFSAGILNPKLF